MFESKYFRKENRACQENLTEHEIFDMRDLIVSGNFLKTISMSEDREDDERKVIRCKVS